MTVKSKVKRNFITCLDNSVEVLPGNFVDKDVLSTFRPFNLIYFFTLFPYYKIKGNFIIPNSFRSKVLSFCNTIFFMFLFAYRSYAKEFKGHQNRNVDFQIINSYLLVLVSCFGVFTNFFSTLKSDLNVKFVLKIQDVHTILNDSNISKRFVYKNWLCVISILSYEIIGWLSINVLLKLPFMDFLCGAITMSFNVHIVCATRLVVLLEDKLNLWNDRVLQLQSMEYNPDTENYCQKLFQAYIDIMECYNIHKVSFQLKVVFYCVDFFFRTLIYIQTIIDHERNMQNLFLLGATNVWIAINVVMQTALSSKFENFYTSVRNSQDTCALVLNSHCTEAARRLCKRVRRTHSATFGKMSAYGLFRVHAALTLSVVSLITHYTIVLLQFAFL